MELDVIGDVDLFMVAKYLKLCVVFTLTQSVYVLAEDADTGSAEPNIGQNAGYPQVAQFFEKSQGASGGGFFEGRNLSNNSLLDQKAVQAPHVSADQYGLEIKDNSVSAEDSYVYKEPAQDSSSDSGLESESSAKETQLTKDKEAEATKDSLDRSLEVAAEESSQDDRVQSVIKASRDIREAIFGKEATRGAGAVNVKAAGKSNGVNLKPAQSVRF